MLDLNNSVAASVDYSYHDMSNWIETSEKCRKKTFPKLVFHLNTKSVDCVRTIVDVVWPCSRVEPHKPREKRKPHLSLGELTWIEPAIQSKTITWSEVNFKKRADLGEL